MNVFGSDSDEEPPPKRVKVKPLLVRPSLPQDENAQNETLLSESESEIAAYNPFNGPSHPATAAGGQSILNNESIGFQMMQKMGFKVGEGLGKEPFTAITEPIQVHAKKGRAGIGSTTVAHDPTNWAPSTESEYRESTRSKYQEAIDRATVEKLQRFCFRASGEDLAVADGSLAAEDVNPLWRPTVDSNGPIVDSGEPTQSTEEELDSLLTYAREIHFYCPFCSVQYDDEADLAANCPGKARAAHPS